MMKQLSKYLMSVALLLPFVSHADEFDITMDVVGANESFDEVIVNRIALPFASASGRQAIGVAHAEAAAAAEIIEEMPEVVDESMDGASLSESLDAGSMVQESFPPIEGFSLSN